MKKLVKVILISCLSLVFVIIILFLFVSLQSRNLSKNIDIDKMQIYVPKGMADRYEDPLAFSNDVFRLWEYELNEAEKAAAESDLRNGIWKKPDESMFNDYMKGVFTYGLPEMPKMESNSIYWCLYDNRENQFVAIHSDAAVNGHRYLFVYDDAQAKYWCIIKSI